MNCEASSCLADVLGCVSGDGRRLALPAGSPWTLAAAGLPKKSVMLVSYRTLARSGGVFSRTALLLRLLASEHQKRRVGILISA